MFSIHWIDANGFAMVTPFQPEVAMSLSISPAPSPASLPGGTLVLVFHPSPGRSVTNAALAAAAAALDGVTVVDMQALYPDGAIDVDREVARLLAASRIVLQFPVQWYATPPLLKAWQDAVLTRMYYIAYEREGRLLEGTPLLVAATAGNVEEAYRPGGANLMPLADLLAPLRTTAHRCRLPWGDPFLVYRAGKMSPEDLAATAAGYARHLSGWRAARSPSPVAGEA